MEHSIAFTHPTNINLKFVKLTVFARPGHECIVCGKKLPPNHSIFGIKQEKGEVYTFVAHVCAKDEERFAKEFHKVYQTLGSYTGADQYRMYIKALKNLGLKAQTI